MITPLLPLRTPAEVEGTYSTESSMAYRLIWENTIAHLKAPQQVSEFVCSYSAGGSVIGVRTLVTSNQSLQPLLPELDERRVDTPLLPLGGTCELDASPLQMVSALPEYVPVSGRGTDTASLVGWLDQTRVVSAGRLGSIINELVDAGWIQLDGDQYRLTPDAESQLQRLGDNKLSVDGLAIARWRLAADRYIGGNATMADLLEDSNRLFGCAVDVPLDEIETRITGSHTAEEAYALRDKAALAASQRMNFPVGMDPERLLSELDPLRERRHKLEASLSEGREHIWLCMSPQERTTIRIGSEVALTKTDVAQKKLASSLMFDVRTRWFFGLSPDATPPSVDAAIRAYTAWWSARSAKAE
jgi:hypothetical protein